MTKLNVGPTSYCKLAFNDAHKLLRLISVLAAHGNFGGKTRELTGLSAGISRRSTHNGDETDKPAVQGPNEDDCAILGRPSNQVMFFLIHDYFLSTASSPSVFTLGYKWLFKTECFYSKYNTN